MLFYRNMYEPFNNLNFIFQCFSLDSRYWSHIYICTSLKWLILHTKVDPFSISLPNGIASKAYFTSIVNLTDDLVIEKVLQLPDINVHLISLSQLKKSLSCMMSFENDSHTIQERTSFKKIGLAKQLGGLYYLETNKVNPIPTSNSIKSQSSNALQHLRLGYFLNDRTRCMNKQYNDILVSDEVTCDISHMARKKQNFPFLLIILI